MTSATTWACWFFLNVTLHMFDTVGLDPNCLLVITARSLQVHDVHFGQSSPGTHGSA